MLARHLWVAALACCVLATTAAPASAQTQKADAVLLASTLADGFTAIDAHRSQARAAVDAWYADQGRCAERHLRLPARSQFTTVRRQMLHAVALQALAPDLERLTETLRALPVKAPAIRGGIREVLIDYRNARELIDAGPPNLCRELRRLRAGRTSSWDTGAFEDVRGSGRALERRGAGLRGAQRALLSVEVDPRLARSLDTVFEHATAGLYRSRLETRERLAPPFAIVTDAAGIGRLRAEAAAAAGATDTLFAARRDVSRRLQRATRRVLRCKPAIVEGTKRRPGGVFVLVGAWLFGEMAAAAEHPVQQYLADLTAAGVTDPALRDLLKRSTEDISRIAGTPRTNLCSELRAWRRAGWARGAIGIGGDPFTAEFIDGGSWSGIRLEDEVIDREVLRRRGVSRDAAEALLDPFSTLFDVEDHVTRTHALANSVRAASAAVIGRGALRSPQAMIAPAVGRAGAR